jgi:nicotinate dehydrogenase subunit A
MAETFKLRVNGRDCEVRADPDAPLLYILRNDLKLKGTRFGCGEGQCGACNVLGGESGLHPVQQAFIDEQAVQCGYCIDGIIISAVALLRREKDPSDAQIAAALERNLCRCGTHVRIFRAIRAAARAMRMQGTT